MIPTLESILTYHLGNDEGGKFCLLACFKWERVICVDILVKGCFQVFRMGIPALLYVCVYIYICIYSHTYIYIYKVRCGLKNTDSPFCQFQVLILWHSFSLVQATKNWPILCIYVLYIYIYIYMTDIDDQPADQDSVGDPQKSPTKSEDIQHQNNYVYVVI